MRRQGELSEGTGTKVPYSLSLVSSIHSYQQVHDAHFFCSFVPSLSPCHAPFNSLQIVWLSAAAQPCGHFILLCLLSLGLLSASPHVKPQSQVVLYCRVGWTEKSNSTLVSICRFAGMACAWRLSPIRFFFLQLPSSCRPSAC